MSNIKSRAKVTTLFWMNEARNHPGLRIFTFPPLRYLQTDIHNETGGIELSVSRAKIMYLHLWWDEFFTMRIWEIDFLYTKSQYVRIDFLLFNTKQRQSGINFHVSSWGDVFTWQTHVKMMPFSSGLHVRILNAK